MEGLTPSKTREETTRSFRIGVIDVRALTTLRTFDSTNWRRSMVVHLDHLASYQGAAQDEQP
jgi:hypothetical protein